MSFYDDLKAGAGKLLDTGVDVYKSTLEANTQKKATAAAAEIEKEKANDIVKIGNVEVSVVKVLAIFSGTLLLVFLLKKG